LGFKHTVILKNPRKVTSLNCVVLAVVVLVFR